MIAQSPCFLCIDSLIFEFNENYTACMKLVADHKDALLEYNKFDNVDDQKTALMPSKSNFYKAAKHMCLDTAKACPKYMYPKKPIPQKER